VFEAVNFETDEALLTGESLRVRKVEEATFPEKTGPGDRLNVAYSSSNVTKGRAKGIVFATGQYTEIGAIAVQLRETKSKVRMIEALHRRGRFCAMVSIPLYKIGLICSRIR
jgi:magnesium-transporting ATPase (P-type)